MSSKKYSLFVIMSLAVLFLHALTAPRVHAQAVPRLMYITPENENLRARQNGPILGILTQGTTVAVIEEQDKWLKVQIVGWIWKESLSSIKPADKNATYRGQYILVATESEAQEILQLLKSGEDFSELAQKRSIAPNAAKGGDLGYFNPEDFLPEISNAITSLNVGEISGVVKVQSRYAVFKRLK